MASEDQTRETDAGAGSLSRRSFLALSAAAAASVVLPGIDSAAAAAQGNCQPFLTSPDYLGIVPTTTQVLGFEAGRREVTTAECYQYLDAVAAASDRVRVGVVGHSAVGREIRYAIIGRPEHVTDAGLEKVRQAHYEIADPSTPQSRVNHLADTTPAFLWVCGNIHGDEESGADAIVSLVYGLADRDDCVVNRLLKNAVVVVIPIQNPDGRAARHAQQLLRLRPEPRPFRAHPARDRRQDPVDAEVPAVSTDRPSRVRVLPLVLPADRRSRLSRGHEPADPRHLRRLRAGHG
jgi:Zinc carboxypeptidase